MSAPITITLDSNERGTDRAKALAQAVGGDPAYELAGFPMPGGCSARGRMDLDEVEE